MMAGIVRNGALAVFLTFLLAGSVAYAQGGPPPSLPQQIAISLSDGLSISEIFTASIPIVTRSITDALSLDDDAERSKLEAVTKEVRDKIDVEAKIAKGLHAYRFISEHLPISDPVSVKGPSAISISNPIGITDEITVGGALTPRSAPIITLQPGPPAVLSPNGDGVDDTMEIAFDSTVGGTYVFEIRDAQGEVASSLTGNLAAGRNTVTWDGKDSSGSVVSSGTYTYYISARNEGGARAPPSEGDGIIVVEGPSTFPIPLPDLNYTAVIAAVAVAAAGTGVLLYMRRRKDLVLYLPAAASEVIDDIREKYPGVTVEDFIEPVEEGTKMYKGVRIENPGKNDENWFTEIINKAKKLAGVDSVNISYGGKVRTI